MATKINDNLLVYTFTKDEIRTLKGVLTYYILERNSNLSKELDRDLKDDEKFLANPDFAEVLKLFDIDRKHWRTIDES